MKHLNQQELLAIAGGSFTDGNADLPSFIEVVGGLVGGMVGASLYAYIPGIRPTASWSLGFYLGAVAGAGVFGAVEIQVKNILFG